MATVNEKMTAIADAIRDKTGGTEKLGLDAMASGVAEVYEAGKKKEWSDSWDIITQNGKRTIWVYAFARWGGETIRPPFKITPEGSADHMFLGIKELKSIEKEYFDFSKATYLGALCNGCEQLEIVEDVNFKGEGNTGYYQAFAYCAKLHTIERIAFGEKTTANEAFHRCTNLQNVTFDGVIGTNISFSYSPLTVESLKNTIVHLKNYTGTDSEGTYTLTLKDTCKTALQADTETVELDGVSYTYFELITAKGWNLA